MKPRLLDLFCGAGGAAKGYQRAGFYVIGVDIEVQKNYCGDEFVQMDALQFCSLLRESPVRAQRYAPDAIHASPPCQDFSAYGRRPNHVKPRGDFITPTRELLEASGLPWVIENVEGAPIRADLLLCGSMFDPPLDVRRHRLFESNVELAPGPWPCRHKLWSPRYPSASNRRKDSRLTVQVGSWGTPKDVQDRAMGIDWMTLEELSEAVPPLYTEHIGDSLLAYVYAEGRAA